MYPIDLPSVPPGHGPWCQCADCQACNNSYGYRQAIAEVYQARLNEALAALWRMQKDTILREEDRQRAMMDEQRRLNELSWHQLSMLDQIHRYEPPHYECARRHEREPRGPAFALAIVGMIIALAMFSQLLFWFH